MLKKVIKFSTFLSLKNSGRVDSDFDGLEDWEELELGTDPFRADSDGDGVKDGVQFKKQKIALELMFMKDMFIPHEGNAFKPYALHPGRVLFYATSAILIKVILIAFIVAMPIEAWLAPDILAGQSKAIVSMTNGLRQQLNLPTLMRQDILDRAAEAKVKNMFAENYFAHVSPAGKGVSDWLQTTGYKYGVAGENLAMGFAKADEIFVAWENSPTHYANLVDPEYKAIGTAITTGVFDGTETTMAAQYFGDSVPPAPAVVKTLTDKDVTKMSKTNLAKTQVKLKVINRTVPDKKLVRAETVLDSNVKKAQIKVGANTINLEPTFQGDKWTGTAIINEVPGQNQPVVPATLSVTSENGEVNSSDLNASVLAVRPNLIAEYNYLKNSPLAGKLWSFTSGYYLAMLFVAVIALLLNIFVQIRRQHPHLIISTLSLIMLLAILVVV